MREHLNFLENMHILFWFIFRPDMYVTYKALIDTFYSKKEAYERVKSLK